MESAELDQTTAIIVNDLDTLKLRKVKFLFLMDLSVYNESKDALEDSPDMTEKAFQKIVKVRPSSDNGEG